MKILLVDDDKYLANILSETLSEENFVVDAVADGETGWYYASSFTYDLILLDVIMPELDGLKLCQRLRENGYTTPILLLTARSSSSDKIKGLNAGADDYIVKPFDFQELIARIKAILRRDSQTVSPLLQWGSLCLDSSTCQVTYEDRSLNLTPKQYALLELFLRNPERVFSPSAIIDRLWSSEEIPGEDTIRTHIKELRQKLKAANGPRDLIKTVYGQGYCLKAEPNQANSTHNQQTEQIAALAKIWEEEYQEVFIARLEVFDRLKQDLVSGAIDPALRQEAELLAHSLAGTLGSFGKPKGSQIATELERLLQIKKSDRPQHNQEFLGLLAALRQEIEQTSPSTTASIAPAKIAQISKKGKNLLIINSDTPLICETIDLAVTSNFDVSLARDLATARDILTHSQIDGAIIEICYLQSCNCSDNTGLSLIKSLKKIAPNLPILVIVDRSNFNDRLAVMRSGAHTFLELPSNGKIVLDAVTKMLARPQISAKVMVVDRDRQLLASLPNLVLPYQFQFTTLDNPNLFWDVLVAVEPDILILSLELPGVSGSELCRIVRSDSDRAGLPVLLLTADRGDRARELIFASGANDYITKPILPAEFTHRILNCLQLMPKG